MPASATRSPKALPYWDPYWDSRARDILRAGDPVGQRQHWAALRHPELELRNFGICGERTDEIAARFERAVRDADALIVQGGINDIAQGRDVVEAAERLRALVERAQALAVCDVLPWNNGWPGAEPPIHELNALIRAISAPLLPFYDTLEDPLRPGRMKDEWTNANGDHPSIDGYRRLGELAFAAPIR